MMQKRTKELFITLKALRPIIHSVSSYYGIDWKHDRLVDKYYLEYPNKHIEFATEKELQDEMQKMINDTSSDLGFRFPETTTKLHIQDGLPNPSPSNNTTIKNKSKNKNKL